MATSHTTVWSESGLDYNLASAENGDLESVRSLIQNDGVDVNFLYPAANNNTMLHSAAYFGHFEVAQFLLENGADASIADKWGATPFHLAFSRHGSVPLVQQLTVGDVSALNGRGKTALHHALMHGAGVDLLQFLIDHGIDINATD